MNEDDYIAGQRQVYADLALYAAKGLNADGRSISSLMAEREQAIAALRRICETYGDLNWSPDLHLADIIEKHLACYLEEIASG